MASGLDHSRAHCLIAPPRRAGMPGGEFGTMQARGRVKVVFIGWGAIGSRGGDLWANREAPVEIAGIATIDEPAARAALPRDIPFLGDPARLAEIKPDLLVEAAGRRPLHPQ